MHLSYETYKMNCINCCTKTVCVNAEITNFWLYCKNSTNIHDCNALHILINRLRDSEKELQEYKIAPENIVC